MRNPLTPTAAMMLGLGLSLSAGAANLLTVHDLAARSDPQLRAADADRRAVYENRRQAISGFLPQISGSASLTEGTVDQTIGGIDIPQPDVDQESYNLSLNQSIWDQGNYENLRVARREVAQADANYQVEYQAFLIRVSERYFDVLTAEDALTFAKAEEEAVGRQLEQAEQRFEVGLTAITDVHEAQARYDNSRARVIQAENVLNDAKEGLAELTGKYLPDVDPLRDELPLVPPQPADMEHWVRTAIESSPSLIASRLNSEIAEAQVRQARAGHYPTLDLVVQYNDFVNNNLATRNPDTGELAGIFSLENEQTTWGLQLNVPIFSGFNTRSRTKQAGIRMEASLERLEQNNRAVVRTTRSNYRGTLAAILEVEARKQAVISGRSALEATEAGFEVGTRTIVDVLLSQQQLFQAERDYSQARHAYILNSLRLKQSSGVLGQPDLAEVNDLLHPVK